MAKLTGKNALICGDSRTLLLTFPFDISGYTVFFTVKTADDTADDDQNAVIQKTVTSHDDPTNGKTSVGLSGTDTRIDPGTYRYDIQAKDSGGNISSSPAQSIEFVADVTKRTS